MDDFPFIYRCEHCGAEPKAYKCHHCNELIFFTKDRLRINYAQCVNIRAESKPAKEDRTAEKISKRNDETGELKHELETTLLKGAIKEAKNKNEPIRMPSITERFNRSVKDENEVRRLKAAVDEEFKNDPVEREKRHRLIDQEFRVGM